MKNKISEKQAIIYGMYNHILDSFQHYNHIQMIYRTFASTWLVTMYIGIGYSLSSIEVNLPFHPLITVILICIASFFGIFLICYMDLIVIERSIAIQVYEAIELENKYPWLPQFVNTCNKLNDILGYINKKITFYIGCFGMIYITLSASTILFFFLKHISLTLFFTLILTSLVFFIFIYKLLFSNKKIDFYKKIKTNNTLKAK